MQLLATSKSLFLHGVSLTIVPVAHVDYSTPYCIHGWFSSCHPFVFVFSLDFYVAFNEFFMFKLYLFYQSLAQCCFCLFMCMCVYLCMSVTVFICIHGVFCVSLLFVFINISRFKNSTELMFACLFVYMSSDFK